MKNQTVSRIFNDLDGYRNFCIDYGHVFNEADLYKSRTPWDQYQRWRSNKAVTNQWDRDRVNFERSEHDREVTV